MWVCACVLVYICECVCACVCTFVCVGMCVEVQVYAYFEQSNQQKVFYVDCSIVSSKLQSSLM